MIQRNTIVGADLLVVGIVIAGLGYSLAQSVSIAAVGFDIAIIGALVLLLVPEEVPKETYNALLKDSISNIEIILEESMLKERAYFIPSPGGKVRAMIPLTSAISSSGSGISSEVLIQLVSRAPERFITTRGSVNGLFLYPPGNELVLLSGIDERDDLDSATRHVLLEFSDLASSIIVSEEGPATIKMQITKPKLNSTSPFFNQCLGTPLSCIASCVAAKVKKTPVRIVDEKAEPDLIRLTLEIIQ